MFFKVIFNVIRIVVPIFVLTSIFSLAKADSKYSDKRYSNNYKSQSIQLGPRPSYLVNDMSKSKLKKKLQSCSKGPFKKSDFSIGHRGAPLQFPEHTKESYIAAAKMGAGILECDVTFTKDKALVCRHSQCDLHTTTNILETPLAAKCSVPFQAAEFDIDGNMIKPATAQCCTSDITLTEFKTLTGKMDAANTRAKTITEYLDGTPKFRTDLYTGNGTLLTHAESIDLFKTLKVKMTPELKSPSVDMPFDGMSQIDYAQKMIDEYKAAGVNPKHVWAQSFNLEDVIYWLSNEPKFGKQAVYLDDDVYGDLGYAGAISALTDVAAKGVNIVAPPMWALVELDENNKIVPSAYAMAAKDAGLDIITWTLERSGKLQNGGGWYYQTTSDAIDDDGDTMEMLHVLAKDIGVLGVFSDWPATTTYYANCMDL